MDPEGSPGRSGHGMVAGCLPKNAQSARDRDTFVSRAEPKTTLNTRQAGQGRPCLPTDHESLMRDHAVTLGGPVYGITGFRAFLNNLQTVILFPAWLKFDDAGYFSEALGNATTEQLTHGTTRRGVLPHQRTTYERPVLRPLLSPEEFADTPEDGAILITTGLRPARVWLPRWFDRPGWLRRPIPSHDCAP